MPVIASVYRLTHLIPGIKSVQKFLTYVIPSLGILHRETHLIPVSF